MSGVYIKDMKMPATCFYCPFRLKVNPDDYVCMILNKEFEETFSLIVERRRKDCPLVPVDKGEKTPCKCYHADKNFLGSIGICYGTKECEACSCGGDESKCDFTIM